MYENLTAVYVGSNKSCQVYLTKVVRLLMVAFSRIKLFRAYRQCLQDAPLIEGLTVMSQQSHYESLIILRICVR